VGLGILACGARRVTDEMFMAAAETLAAASPAHADPAASLLPPVADIKAVSRAIAVAVAKAAVADGVAPQRSEDELRAMIDDSVWEPSYRSYRRVS